MHSESLEVHEIALVLYKKNRIQSNLDFGIKHKAIIEELSRYPHRNKILGRESTVEEIDFLIQSNSGFNPSFELWGVSSWRRLFG